MNEKQQNEFKSVKQRSSTIKLVIKMSDGIGLLVGAREILLQVAAHVRRELNNLFSTTGANMISRIWHGWTTHENADTYESLLNKEIFVGIKNRKIEGFKDIQLLRRTVGDEV